MVRRSFLLLLVCAQAVLAQPAAAPAAGNPADAEAARCEQQIASVRRDVLNRYDNALQELQVGFQKAADLEGAVAVRNERQRVAQDATLSEANFVSEPKQLHAVQEQWQGKLQELLSQLINDSIPRLIEIKKGLTIAGRLDEALAAKSDIERLHGYLVPDAPPPAGAILTVDAVLRAYAADKARADSVYKGQHLSLHGIVVGYKPDPDGRHYLLFVSGQNPNGGWIQCSFGNEVRFREEKQFNTSNLLASWGGNDGSSLRLQKGSVVDVSGNCLGWEETLKLNKCELGKPGS
jgi:hypothetical protein